MLCPNERPPVYREPIPSAFAKSPRSSRGLHKIGSQCVIRMEWIVHLQ